MATHLKELVVQGAVFRVDHLQEADVAWRAAISGFHRREYQFILNAVTDTLPTLANKVRWSWILDDQAWCPLCSGHKQTLAHILGNCNTARIQGRTKWRHDSILKQVVLWLRNCLPVSWLIIADLPGEVYQLPPCVQTGGRPDIVIVNHQEREVWALELTCPLERNAELRHAEKTNKYTNNPDLRVEVDDGWKLKIFAFEVTALGWPCKTFQTVLNEFKHFTNKKSRSELAQLVSKTAIRASYTLYVCRAQREWRQTSLL